MWFFVLKIVTRILSPDMNCQKDIFLTVLLWRPSLSLWAVSPPYYILSQIYDYDGRGEDDRSLWFLRWDDDDDQDVSYFVRIERRRCPLLLTLSVRFISRSLCFLRCTLLEIVWSHQLHSKSWKEGHYYKTCISPWEAGAHPLTLFLLHSMPDLLLRPNHCNLW